MKYWTTADGTEIPYRKLEDSHLLNILKLLKRLAKNGITIEIGGGAWDIEDMWYDSWEEKGQEVLDRYDYKGLLKEARRRKLKVK